MPPTCNPAGSSEPSRRSRPAGAPARCPDGARRLRGQRPHRAAALRRPERVRDLRGCARKRPHAGRWQGRIAGAGAGREATGGRAGAGSILFLTDGIGAAHAPAFAAHAQRSDDGVLVLAVGTREGGPIRTGDGRFETDAAGRRVMATLDVRGSRRSRTRPVRSWPGRRWMTPMSGDSNGACRVTCARSSKRTRRHAGRTPVTTSSIP